MKGKRCHLFFFELPLFVIIAPANYIGIAVTLLAILAICFLAQKFDLYQHKHLEKKILPLAIIIAVLLGVCFVNKWMMSSKVASIAEVVHLSPKTFLIVIGGLLSIASVWGISNLISIVRNINKKLPDDIPISANDFCKFTRICSATKKNKLSCYSLVFLVSILTAQLLMMVYFGDKKSGYHCDEIFTFELSNYEETFLGSGSGDYYNTWNDGEFYLNTVSATNNRFDYITVWRNQANDVHPPFYYVIVHTVASLFPVMFSKWIGLIPNFVFSLLTTIVLFYFAKRIFESDAFALLTAGGWALSVGAMSAAIFIRMYTMLTFFCVLLILLHLKFADGIGNRPANYKTVFPLYLCTLCGILTQYYFMVFCFFFCGMFFLALLRNKQYKSLFHYIIAEFSAILSAYIIFPSMYNHIFDGYRGKEAFANVVIGDAYFSKLNKIVNIIVKNSIGKIPFFCLFALFILVALIAFFRSVSKKEMLVRIFDSFNPICALAVTALCYIIVITRIAPYQADRYYMCIYPIITILLVYSISFVCKQFTQKRRQFIFTAVFFIGFTLLNYCGNSVNYLYSSWVEREVLADYSGSQAIVLNVSDYFAFSNYTPEYVNYSEIYVCDKSGFDSLEHIDISKLNQQFLLYAYKFGDAKDESEMIEQIQKYLPVKYFERLATVSCPVYLCVLEE